MPLFGKKGPLAAVQQEGDSLKKKIDGLIKECTASLEDSTIPDRPKKLKSLHKRCIETKEGVEGLLKRADDLKKEGDPKVNDFETKKEAELSRLKEWKDKLEGMVSKLEPDEVEEDYLHKMKKGEITETDDQGEEDEQEEEPVEEEEEEEEDEEGEEEEIEEDEEDVEEEEEVEEEEIEEEDEEDDEDDEDEEEDEEEEEEQEEDAESEASTPRIVQYEALCDFEGEQEEDLSFKHGDILSLILIREDGWWECEDSEGNKGLVPSTYLKEHSRYKAIQSQDVEEENEDDEKEDTKTPRSGKKLWSSIKKSLKETSATDVLHAMGAVPSGFRLPTLGKLYADGDEYTMKNYLIPKLSTSNLSFRDLFFNPVTNKIRPRPVRFQKIVTLQAARQIPHAGTGIEVINYCVRMCLFNGAKVLSNIVTVRSFCTDKELKNWSFHTKLTDNLPCIDYAEIFVRDNKGDKDIGVLFELCLGYKRVKTGELGEFSCGWAHLPLFAEDGTPALNKTYDLYVNGGTPYEKGIEVDPSVSRRESTNKWRALVSKNKQPRLSVKLSAPTKEQKEQLDTLPDVLIGSMCHLGSLSYYRQFLADALLRDRLDMQSTDLVHSPFLMSFPSVMEQPDILDVFRAAWIEKLKITKRGDKRDAEHMKELFRQTFLETCYPLCHSANLQHYIFGDADVEQARAAELTKIAQMNKEKNSALAALLSPDVAHLPFDMKELSFDVLGPFCLVK